VTAREIDAVLNAIRVWYINTMNQDQVKEQLLRIEEDVEEFFLIFSGKESKKVNGLYHPDKREIIIHNRNFDSDDALMYTAIHEFAHHVHFTTSPVPVGPRAHTIEFRSILHRLLQRAEEIGVYNSPFESDPEIMGLTYRIRNEFLTKNGELMKQFGAALQEAEQLCRARGARFEDYLERVLHLDRRTASTLIRINAYDIDPSIGYQNMTTVASLRNDAQRTEAITKFKAGESSDSVKAAIRSGRHQETVDPLDALEKERKRIQRTIESLESKLTAVENRIVSLGGATSES
jgi:hypothetical protein